MFARQQNSFLSNNFYPLSAHNWQILHLGVSHTQKKKKTKKQKTHKKMAFFSVESSNSLLLQLPTLFLTNFKQTEYTNDFFLANSKSSLKFSSFQISLQDLTPPYLLLFLKYFIPMVSTVAFPTITLVAPFILF